MGFAEDYVGGLAELRFEDSFNPYADLCPVHDLPNAPALRRGSLIAVINRALEQGTDSLWVGLAPGHKGARRTGLAFTDDCVLQAHAERWGIELPRPTTGEMIEEPTTQDVWEVLSPIKETVFLWNAFPLHPHKPNKPFSNRLPSAQEFAAGREALKELIAALDPIRIVAVGKEADKGVKGIGGGRGFVKVRHPGHGGKPGFTAGIRELYPGDEEYAD